MILVNAKVLGEPYTFRSEGSVAFYFRVEEEVADEHLFWRYVLGMPAECVEGG